MVSMHGFLMAQVNDPLLKLPWLSSLYFNSMFFARRDPLWSHFLKNYAKSIPNHSEKRLTGVTLKEK